VTVTAKDFIRRALMIDILKGMALTFRMMLSKPVTIQYPEEKRKIYPGFRGKHAFVRNPKTGKEKCIMCMKCANICPSQCIYIKKGRDANNKPFLEQYDIEALRCIYCGYCVEVCPVCALVLTEDFSYVSTSKSDIYFNKEKMLTNWDEFASTLDTDVYWNKFWRPDGVDISKMPKAKREQAPVNLRPEPVKSEEKTPEEKKPEEKPAEINQSKENA
jgi:NADH-quinone oxidoreductase chain I